MADSLFYLLAAGIVLFSILVVSLPNLLHAALALIASFASTAGLYILLKAEFVAMAQVMVYIGGVVIFIVFAILLTTQLGERFLSSGKITKGLSLALSALVFFGIFYFATCPPLPAGTPADANAGSLTQVGIRLMSIGKDGFIVPFEIISVLLIAAVVGAIVTARKSSENQEASEK